MLARWIGSRGSPEETIEDTERQKLMPFKDTKMKFRRLKCSPPRVAREYQIFRSSSLDYRTECNTVSSRAWWLQRSYLPGSFGTPEHRLVGVTYKNPGHGPQRCYNLPGSRIDTVSRDHFGTHLVLPYRSFSLLPSPSSSSGKLPMPIPSLRSSGLDMASTHIWSSL